MASHFNAKMLFGQETKTTHKIPMKRIVVVAAATKIQQMPHNHNRIWNKMKQNWKNIGTLFKRVENFGIHSSDEPHKYYVKCEHDLARKRTKTTEIRVCVFCSFVEWNRILIMSFIHTYYTLTHTQWTLKRTSFIEFAIGTHILLLAASSWNTSFLLLLSASCAVFFRQISHFSIWFVSFSVVLAVAVVLLSLFHFYIQDENKGLAILLNPRRKWFGLRFTHFYDAI